MPLSHIFLVQFDSSIVIDYGEGDPEIIGVHVEPLLRVDAIRERGLVDRGMLPIINLCYFFDGKYRHYRINDE